MKQQTVISTVFGVNIGLISLLVGAILLRAGK